MSFTELVRNATHAIQDHDGISTRPSMTSFRNILPRATTPLLLPIVVKEHDGDQTIVFGVIGTLIGVSGLVLAGLTLRIMYRKHKEDEEVELRNIDNSVSTHDA